MKEQNEYNALSLPLCRNGGLERLPSQGQHAAYANEAPKHKGGFSGRQLLSPAGALTLFKLLNSTSGRRGLMFRTQKGHSVA